jgi:drug/metabolite transporter (DMT)-like permease
MLRTAEGSRLHAFGPVEWGLLGAVAVIWGSSFLLIAEGLEAYSPGMVTWVRLTLGMLTLAMFPASRRRVDRTDWPPIAALAMVWMAVPFLLFPIAQQWISSSLAGMLNGAMPLFAAVVATLLLRRLPGRAQLVGLLIGFAGVTLLTLYGAEDPESSTVLGIALVLVAVACYGFAVNIAVPLQQRYGSLPVLLRALGVASVATAPFGLAGIGDASLELLPTLSIVGLGALGSGVAFVAMANLVGRAGATRGAVAVYFIPIVALVLGIIVRDETVTVPAVIGIGLVLVGAYVTSRRDAAAARQAARAAGEQAAAPSPS